MMREPRTFEEALDRIADLEEIVASLTGELVRAADLDRAAHYRARWGLTAKECALLECLYSRAPRCVTRDTIMSALYAEDAEEPDRKIVDVFICKLRSKLGREAIVSEWGLGYWLSAEASEAIKTLLETPLGAVIRDETVHPGKRANGLHTEVRRALSEGSRTIREVCSATGWSYTSVTNCLNSLLRHGHVHKAGGNHVNGPSAWRLSEKGRRALAERSPEAPRLEAAA